MVDAKTIEKMAELARIKLSLEEKDGLTKDMQSILSYVDQIKEAGAEKAERDSSVNFNVFRKDENPHESGIYTEKLLGESPDREGSYIKVKKIL